MTLRHLPEVLGEVEPLGRLFVDAGHDLYLVGGIVRDQWLDRGLEDSSDVDLTTDAHPDTIKQLVSEVADDLWTQGEKFGTIGLRVGGRDYEITTFRAESYASQSRKPTVSFGDNLDVDLSRRDFTVNAMAIQLPDGELVDPYHGAADLKSQRLRTPLSPETSFTDDPLRMLRAARFSAKYSLVPTPELVNAATELHQRIRIVAIERIGVELRRLLSLDASPVGLRFLSQTGLLAEVLAYGEPGRISDVQPRLDRAIAMVEACPRDWHLALSAIGLVVFDDPDGVQAMSQRLRLSGDDEKTVVDIARAVNALPVGPMPEAPAIRRFAIEHGLDEEPIRLGFRLADQPNGESALLAAVAQLVSVEGVPELTLIDGGTIMDALGIKPGPAVGEAHTYLKTCYFEQGPLTEQEQLSLLQTWWADRTNKS